MTRAFAVMLVLSFVLTTGCQLAQDLSEMQEKQRKVTLALSKELDTDVQVGWNINNGVLSRITVVVQSEAVLDMTVPQLKSKVTPVIMEHFEKVPTVLYISVAVPGAQL